MKHPIHVLVIDGQGGRIGSQLISAIKNTLPDLYVTGVGTNTLATSAMLKTRADACATGENAVIVGCRKADFIIGPIGIVIADSLYGEVTPAMATAVGQSPATRILIPFNHCDNHIVGVSDFTISVLLERAIEELRSLL